MPGNFAQIETYIPPLPPLNREHGQEASSTSSSGVHGETNPAMDNGSSDNSSVAFECNHDDTAPLVQSGGNTIQNDII